MNKIKLLTGCFALAATIGNADATGLLDKLFGSKLKPEEITKQEDDFHKVAVDMEEAARSFVVPISNISQGRRPPRDYCFNENIFDYPTLDILGAAINNGIYLKEEQMSHAASMSASLIKDVNAPFAQFIARCRVAVRLQMLTIRYEAYSQHTAAKFGFSLGRALNKMIDAQKEFDSVADRLERLHVGGIIPDYELTYGLLGKLRGTYEAFEEGFAKVEENLPSKRINFDGLPSRVTEILRRR